MLPPRRLRTLLSQAEQLQKERCPLHNGIHNGDANTFSLLVDHACNRYVLNRYHISLFCFISNYFYSDDFPSETVQLLTNHCDEVWFCRFSNDGSRLATGSKDGNVMIYEVDPVNFRVKHLYTLAEHSFGVSYLSWSPDDSYLIACGPDDCADLWIWNMKNGTLQVKVSHSAEDSLTTCSWHKDGRRFVCGGTRGQFYKCVSKHSLHNGCFLFYKLVCFSLGSGR